MLQQQGEKITTILLDICTFPTFSTSCMFSHTLHAHPSHFFLGLAKVTRTCFPALGTSYVFLSLTLLVIHIFPHLTPVTCFPLVNISYMFSHPGHWLQVFQYLAPVAHFPVLGTSYMFSLTWHRLHVFLRLAPVTCFPALGTGYIYCFPVLGTGLVFSYS